MVMVKQFPGNPDGVSKRVQTTCLSTSGSLARACPFPIKTNTLEHILASILDFQTEPTSSGWQQLFITDNMDGNGTPLGVLSNYVSI
jgi:hypothetical protein